MFSVRKFVSTHSQSVFTASSSYNLPILFGNCFGTFKGNHLRTYSILQSFRNEKKKSIPAYTENDRGETLIYTAVDPKSTRITQLLVKTKSKRSRYTEQLILVEGKRLITEALKAKVKPVMILFSRKNLVEGLPLDVEYASADRSVLHQIPYKDLKLWSDLTTSPGIFGIFAMPNLQKRKSPVDKLPITLVCDNVREPGNLGSILRIAAALPVDKVVLVTGCTDLWDSKVIRSSSGAMFYLNIAINSSWDDVNDICKGKVLLADHLPCQKSYTTPVSSEEIVENYDTVYDEDDNIEKVNLRDTYKLPLKSSFDMHADGEEPLVIVIGGETEGLSEDAFQLAASRNGYRVNIPLSECVDSLNAGAALGIITFELKRQLLLRGLKNSASSEAE